MKRFNILFVLLIMFTACKGQNNESETTKETVKAPTYASFGDKITADEGREVVLNGLAFASEMSVEDQKHYAKDAGMDQEKIDAIATPKKTYSFIADGVLLKE